MLKYSVKFLLTATVINALTCQVSQAESIEDYGYREPIPVICRVTVRQNLRYLNRNRLFASCPNSTNLYAFAESTNYVVMVCSNESISNAKYWIQMSKIDRKILSFTALYDVRGVPYWQNGNSSLFLYSDGIRCGNAYLTMGEKSEAILYHYDKWYRSLKEEDSMRGCSKR